jgi:ribonuclease J
VRGLSLADEADLELALEDLERTARAAFGRLSHGDKDEDEAIEAALVRALRKSAEKIWRKRPLVDVSVLRI